MALHKIEIEFKRKANIEATEIKLAVGAVLVFGDVAFSDSTGRYDIRCVAFVLKFFHRQVPIAGVDRKSRIVHKQSLKAGVDMILGRIALQLFVEAIDAEIGIPLRSHGVTVLDCDVGHACADRKVQTRVVYSLVRIFKGHIRIEDKDRRFHRKALLPRGV